jgi:hypothetical protein
MQHACCAPEGGDAMADAPGLHWNHSAFWLCFARRPPIPSRLCGGAADTRNVSTEIIRLSGFVLFGGLDHLRTG